MYKVKGVGSEQTIAGKVKVRSDDTGKITRVEDRQVAGWCICECGVSLGSEAGYITVNRGRTGFGPSCGIRGSGGYATTIAICEACSPAGPLPEVITG